MIVKGDPFAQFGDLAGSYTESASQYTQEARNALEGQRGTNAGVDAALAAANQGTGAIGQSAYGVYVPATPILQSLRPNETHDPYGHLMDYQMENYRPPVQCMTEANAFVAVPLKRYIDARVQIDPHNQDDIQTALSLLTVPERTKIDSYQKNWLTKYPWAPPSTLFMWTRRIGSTNQLIISVRRPVTEWDPILYNPPPIEKGDPREAAFAAALRIFFPDYVFDKKGSNPGFYHGYGSGSYTPDGPFPLGVKYVSDRMIDFAIDFMNAGGFGDPAIAKNMSIAGSALKSASVGIGVGASVGGPVGAAAGAVVALGSLIADIFGNDDPKPPKWLTMLLQMQTLREAGLPGPSFRGIRYPLGNLHGPVGCHRAIINPTEDGKYTLLDGYAEFLKRWAAGGKKGSWWKWGLVAAAGAAIAAGS